MEDAKVYLINIWYGPRGKDTGCVFRTDNFFDFYQKCMCEIEKRKLKNDNTRVVKNGERIIMSFPVPGSCIAKSAWSECKFLKKPDFIMSFDEYLSHVGVSKRLYDMFKTA